MKHSSSCPSCSKNLVVIVAKVRDVKKNPKHRKLPEQLVYSVVGDLLRIEKQ